MLVYIILLVFSLSLLTFLINRRLKDRIARQRFNIFNDSRRNLDELIIGIPNSQVEYGRDNVYYSLWNNRSLYSSFVILKALFSLLREDGNGLVTIYSNRCFDGIGFFDYAILHDRTIEEEQCLPNKLNKRCPLFYLILQFFQRTIQREVVSKAKWDCLCNDIQQFCEERNIKVNIIQI